MNQPALLHIVERLEGLVGKLPETLQKPILRELTPLKELFLQQRPPRFVFAGSNREPLADILKTLFASTPVEQNITAQIESGRWQDLGLEDHGTISILDARGLDVSRNADIQTALSRQPADLLFFMEAGDDARGRKIDIQTLEIALAKTSTKAIEVITDAPQGAKTRHDGNSHETDGSHAASTLKAIAGNRFQGAFRFSSLGSNKTSRELMSILARELPNEARIEMIRISRDREAQREVAQILVKSTAAVCTAIGAQPIPLADLPILTTLQLVMVSGIMYLSGRERSLRAATEFMGALGANVGAGMLLREGTRALLKFFPGWGNVICGMVAGAGTYAIGRAAIVFFLEGLSLKDAKRVYRISRKRPDQPLLEARKPPRRLAKRRK
jgi:uncharacterized protein (DUF697 family)